MTVSGLGTQAARITVSVSAASVVIGLFLIPRNVRVGRRDVVGPAETSVCDRGSIGDRRGLLPPGKYEPGLVTRARPVEPGHGRPA